jgi:Flp pilus assembly protein protease CpaA
MLFFPLLALTTAVSLYDLYRSRIPNGVTLTLLSAGAILHFPGDANTWLVSLVLFLAWRSDWMAAGDAKLWMSLIWMLPPASPTLFFATFFITGLLQITLRKFKHQPLTGIRSPGAWRAIPFILWSLYVH